MTSLYASLADVRRELNADLTIEDKDVMYLIRQFSSRIDRMFKQRNASFFAPSLETRTVQLTPDNINSVEGTLTLKTPQNGTSSLLALTGVLINTTSLTVGTNVNPYPTPIPPYFQIQLIGGCCNTWYTYTWCNGVRGPTAANITGIWGYNADYQSAWLSVDTLAAAITTTTATTFTVADVDGDDPNGESPRISAGNLIQIDSEWMNVISTVVATNTVTVVRGVNGSVAATHLIAAPVSVWQTDLSVRRLVARQVAAIYARKGAFETVRISEIGIVSFPPDLMTEVNDLLLMFANL